jgi:DNA-directed RNA polymerase specialized sigma24 family protein
MSASGPSSEPSPGCDPVPDDAPLAPARPLVRRLTAEQRGAIVKAYASGKSQKDFALQYGTSERSVKRLVNYARRSGMEIRTRAI